MGAGMDSIRLQAHRVAARTETVVKPLCRVVILMAFFLGTLSLLVEAVNRVAEALMTMVARRRGLVMEEAVVAAALS